MRRLATLIILAVALMLAPGCRPAPPPNQQPDKIVVQQPDDIVAAPGGRTYRANIIQAGVTNPWPPIQAKTVALSEDDTVNYRANIETKAGETRNNIVRVRKAGSSVNLDLNLLVSGIPAGIEVKEGGETGGLLGRAGKVGKVLIIEISQDVEPGEYTFDIGFELDGKDYGKIPCTINVIQD
ncbi:hypothetical protein ACFLVC_00670 [Chloroflexota bacterium]